MRPRRVALPVVLLACTLLGCDRDSSDSFDNITGGKEAFAMSVSARAAKPTIVLVHGALAGALSFQELIPLLQQRNYQVIAVENTLTGLDADIATTKRVIDAQKGPVIVLGHSYGGAVITGAAAGNPNVKALVYVAAFAPEANEPVAALQGNFPPSELGPALVPDAAGFLYCDPAKFREVFALDVPVRATRTAAVAQKPINATAFGASTPLVAWHTVPSWYMVATEDHAINPDLERFYAKRMHAHTIEVRSSHVMYISHPEEVARVIDEAAKATAVQP